MGLIPAELQLRPADLRKEVREGGDRNAEDILGVVYNSSNPYWVARRIVFYPSSVACYIVFNPEGVVGCSHGWRRGFPAGTRGEVKAKPKAKAQSQSPKPKPKA